MLTGRCEPSLNHLGKHVYLAHFTTRYKICGTHFEFIVLRWPYVEGFRDTDILKSICIPQKAGVSITNSVDSVRAKTSLHIKKNVTS